MGPHLMLVLIAPNPDPGWTGFDAGFHRAQNGHHFGPLKMARLIQHTRSDVPSGTLNLTHQMAHQLARLILRSG